MRFSLTVRKKFPVGSLRFLFNNYFAAAIGCRLALSALKTTAAAVAQTLSIAVS
jgi:hypothetical protein